MLTMMAARGNQ